MIGKKYDSTKEMFHTLFRSFNNNDLEGVVIGILRLQMVYRFELRNILFYTYTQLFNDNMIQFDIFPH